LPKQSFPPLKRNKTSQKGTIVPFWDVLFEVGTPGGRFGVVVRELYRELCGVGPRTVPVWGIENTLFKGYT
jgi:hypothetical protein